MTSIVSIILSVVLLLIISIGFGKAFNKQGFAMQILFGFACLLCLLFIVDIFLVSFHSSKKLIFILYFIICLVGFVLFIRNCHNIKIPDKWVLLMMILFVGIMVVIFMNRTLGLQGFDSMHYMSVVNEGVISDKFGFINYETGALTNSVSITDDYESFYHLNSFILWGWTCIYQLLNLSQIFTVQIYIWTMSIMFFILLFCFYVEVTERFQLTNFQKVAAGIFVLLFIAGHYWNNALSFLGNTYRQFYSCVISLEIYSMLKNKTFSMKECINLSILTGALIAYSSSGFLLSFIVLFCLLVVMLYQSVKDYGKKVIILTVPSVMYGAVYFYNTSKLYWIYLLCVFLFYAFCGVYDYFFYDVWKKRITKIITLILILVWGNIIALSINCILQGEYSVLEFFSEFSSYDMIWDFFSIKSFLSIIINTLIFVGAVLFLKTERKSLYLSYLLLLIFFFVNPISAAFVKIYLADILYQRILETVFNYFTCGMFVLFTLEWIRKWNRNGARIVLCVLAFVSVQYLNSYYHPFFVPNSDFQPLYKIEKDELEVLMQLNVYAKDSPRRYRVVSQSDAAKGYLSNIQLMHKYRGFDKYSLNKKSSILFKLFIKRDYPGQVIFENEPDFHCMCDTLVQNKVDFVIIDKNQTYYDDGKHLSITFLIRDCADLLFENEKYGLYRFYWDE